MMDEQVYHIRITKAKIPRTLIIGFDDRRFISESKIILYAETIIRLHGDASYLAPDVRICDKDPFL